APRRSELPADACHAAGTKAGAFAPGLGGLARRHAGAAVDADGDPTLNGRTHRAAGESWLLRHRRALNQFDARAPRVGDVGDGGPGRRVFTRRLVELDAFRLDLLHEG